MRARGSNKKPEAVTREFESAAVIENLIQQIETLEARLKNLSSNRELKVRNQETPGLIQKSRTQKSRYPKQQGFDEKISLKWKLRTRKSLRYKN
ncbi:14351_t:CDS:2 [Dentiscutata heterogama]|uniref:14351_t:CDS:1 n=1 Tax=Dentiscutata heterogama TaxID=1316150 RepID=A0ACA9K6G8_9GLOM|nr:14351_t:CDS:2 [Dentiscutata heterogama]